MALTGIDFIFWLIGVLVVTSCILRWLWIKICPFEPWINPELKDWLKNKKQ